MAEAPEQQEQQAAAPVAQEAAPENQNRRGGRGGREGGGREGGGRGGREGGGRGGRDGRGGKDEQGDGLIDKLVAINRTAKTVKGGRRFGFTALVVVGDGNGKVGFGKGKSKEVADARKKAADAARKAMIRIPLREGRTVHHDAFGVSGAGKVVVRTAPAGTGIIAGGPMRAVFEALGVKDVVAKSTGSSNPFNMIRATFDALDNIQSPRSTAERLGKKVGDIIARREGAAAASDIEGAEAEDKASKKKKA